MRTLPTRTEAPSPINSSMDGDYRHLAWTDHKMPYLIFLPRYSPFHGPLFERLNYTAERLPLVISEKGGWCLEPILVAKWTSLENALRNVLHAMYQVYPGAPYEVMLPSPYPSRFGYNNPPWRNRRAAASVAMRSRDAFLPLMANITMMFVLLDWRGVVAWRERVMEATDAHPQWFADLESSAAGNMKTERVGGIIDLSFEILTKKDLTNITHEHPMNTLLAACLGRLNVPLYLHWGAVDGRPQFPIPSVLLEKKFFPDHLEIKYLHGLPGNVAFSPWDCDGKEYISLRDYTPQPTRASGLAATAPSFLSQPSSFRSASPAENVSRKFPPVVPGSGQKVGEDIHAFLARRNEKYEKWLATETSSNRAKRLAREAHASKGGPPGKKGATVFVWEEENDFLVRRPINRSLAADMWDEFTSTQRRYDSWANEWDLCTALDPEAEAGYDDDGEGYIDFTQPEAAACQPAEILHSHNDDRMDISHPEPEFPEVPDVQDFLLPEEPIGAHSTADDLQAVYTSWDLNGPQEYYDELYEPFLDMKDILYSRFGFTTPVAPAQYQENLRLDFCLRSVGDEQWSGLSIETCAQFSNLLAFLVKAKSLEDVPQQLLDLRQDEAEISSSDWVVDVERKILNGETFYIIKPSDTDPDQSLHILLQSAATTLQIVRMGWGSSTIEEIVFHLLQRGMEFRLCHQGLLRPQPPVLKSHTGLGVRRAGYKPTVLDYLAYERRRAQFLQTPRGRAARFAGGIIGRIASEHSNDERASRGPSDEIYENGVRFWDGWSQSAYWDDVLTPEEIDLICGVYIVETGLPEPLSK